MYCSRTGRPTACASTAASMAASPASLRPYEPGPVTQMVRTFSTGTWRVAAIPSRTKWVFCDPLQQVTLPSLISTSAQAGPMLACDWNGHSYSASIMRAAVVNASSTLPTLAPTSRLRTVAARMWS
jgi:hypothetical protein